MKFWKWYGIAAGVLVVAGALADWLVPLWGIDEWSLWSDSAVFNSLWWEGILWRERKNLEETFGWLEWWHLIVGVWGAIFLNQWVDHTNRLRSVEGDIKAIKRRLGVDLDGPLP